MFSFSFIIPVKSFELNMNSNCLPGTLFCIVAEFGGGGGAGLKYIQQ